MNKENAIKRINKYGKIGKIITIIMIVCVSFSLLATTAASITMYAIPADVMTLKIGTQAELTLNPKALDPNFDESMLVQIDEAFDTGSAGLNLGVVRMTLNSADIVGDTIVARSNDSVGTLSLRSIGNALVAAVVCLIFTLVSVIFALRLCAAFEKCESPFEENVIKKMRTFAWSLLPWAVLSSLTQDLVSNMFANNVEIGVSLDMNIIFTVIVILALTVVFKYGAMLQQESDETL